MFGSVTERVMKVAACTTMLIRQERLPEA